MMVISTMIFYPKWNHFLPHYVLLITIHRCHKCKHSMTMRNTFRLLIFLNTIRCKKINSKWNRLKYFYDNRNSCRSFSRKNKYPLLRYFHHTRNYGRSNMKWPRKKNYSHLLYKLPYAYPFIPCHYFSIHILILLFWTPTTREPNNSPSISHI